MAVRVVIPFEERDELIVDSAFAFDVVGSSNLFLGAAGFPNFFRSARCILERIFSCRITVGFIGSGVGLYRWASKPTRDKAKDF